jgi:hypothetical protein
MLDRFGIASRQRRVELESRSDLSGIKQLSTLFGRFLALCFPPQHDGIYERLWLMARNVPQGCYELVEGGVYTRSADTLYPGLGLPSLSHALIDLLLGLANERVEQVVQRIFANRLEFVGVRRRVARLGAMVIMALSRGSSTRRPLRLALSYAAVA